MTIGEKIKENRKKAGLSQEQLAEKLCVSRQAITKWEADRGLPDVANLQSIAKLFGVSVDALLDDGETAVGTVVREPIDLKQYQKTGKARSRADAAVRAKYPAAKVIQPLVRQKKLTLLENVVDFVVQSGVVGLADSLRDMSSYYLVELENKHLLVNVTDG